MAAKRFALLFLLAYLLTAGGIVGLGAWLQPYEGDLTRVGGKAENYYGWNQPQASFGRNLSRYYNPQAGHYAGEEDLVVFGDSFSHMGDVDGRYYGWQNYLIAATGLSVFTYNVNLEDPREWLRQQPADKMPRVFILQRIERRLSEYKSERPCRTPAAAAGLDAFSMLDPALAPDTITRPTGGALELQTAAHYLKTNMRDKQEVLRFTLSRDDLFSSARPGEILIYEDDFLADAKRRSGADIAKLICYIEELRELAEANGNTKFLLAAAPDKYTVYRPFIRNASEEDDLFMRLEAAGMPLLRFDQLFQEQVRSGGRDIYLPNDTHWGSEGSRLFASVVAAAIQQQRGLEAPQQGAGNQ